MEFKAIIQYVIYDSLGKTTNYTATRSVNGVDSCESS